MRMKFTLTQTLSLDGRGSGLTCSVTPARCDKSGGELIDRVGINTYFGSVNLLDIRCCEYIGGCAFSVDSPSI